MKPYEITKDIFIVGGPDITDGRDGCVYLINLGELILIDTGAGWSVEKIINNIEKFGFDCKNLNKILLTHCHIDHIGGVPEIKKRFDSKIYIHKLDAPPLETGDQILTAAKWYQTSFPPTTPSGCEIESSRRNINDWRTEDCLPSYTRSYSGIDMYLFG